MYICIYCLLRSLRTVWLQDVTFSEQHTASILAVPSYSEYHSTILHHNETLKLSNVIVPCNGSLTCSLVIIANHCSALTHISASPKTVLCGNKMPTRCNRGFYCRSYCLLNMFRASLSPSSGAQEYYTVVAACGILCCGFFK